MVILVQEHFWEETHRLTTEEHRVSHLFLTRSRDEGRMIQ